MVTQTIKRWFHKLFAWWPGRKSTRVMYVESTAYPYYEESTQETISHATMDGLANQSGSLTYHSLTEEWITEQYILPPTLNEAPEVFRPALPKPPMDRGLGASIEPQGDFSEPNETPLPSQLTSDQEQQLAFLYYLVKKGIVNEGFDKDQVPEQYHLP